MTLHARKDDPSTSHAAMDKISEKQMLILKNLHNNINSGATCNELSEQMGAPRDHVSPNMPKLEEKQLVKRSGYKRDGQQIWLHKNYIGWFSPLEGDKVMEVKPRKPSRNELVEALQEVQSMFDNSMECASDGYGEEVWHGLASDLKPIMDNVTELLTRGNNNG